MRVIFRLMVVAAYLVVNLYILSDTNHSYAKFKRMSRPVTTKPLTRNPPRNVMTLDIDHDGEDELFQVYAYNVPDKQAVSLSEPFDQHYQSLYYGEFLVPLNYVFFDAWLDKKSQTYIFRFINYQNGKLMFTDIDNRQNQIRQVQVKTPGLRLDDKAGISFIKPILCDLDGDGRRELLVILKQDSTKSPGTILCIDLDTEESRWHYLCGPVIVDAQCYDMDRDGKKEIVLSTFAALNGVIINNTSDMFSYAIALSSNGDFKWLTKIGGRRTFTRVLVTDLEGDGNTEIIAATEAHLKRERTEGEIMVLHAATGTIDPARRLKLQECSFSSPLACLTQSGTRIYIGDSNGNIFMLDQQLRQIKMFTINKKAPVRILNSPFTHKPPFYIFAYSQGQLMIIDRKLQHTIFKFNYPAPTPINDMLTTPLLLSLKTRNGRYALVNSDKLYLLRFSDVFLLENLWHSGLLFRLLILLITNGVSIFLWLRFRDQRHMTQHLKSGGQGFYHSFIVIQAIAHQFKTPIATVTWTAEKIKRSLLKEKPVDCSQLGDFLSDDVKTMREQSENLLKLVRIRETRFMSKNLKPLLQRLVLHYRSLVDETIDIEFEMKEDAVIYMAEELLREALINFIDNALEAMPRGGKLRVAAMPVAISRKNKRKQVLVEIEDTGCGISPEDIPRIFDPFFTKKVKTKGTGIGLAISKHIIEAHGGTISLHSRKDLGTKIAFTIPVKHSAFFGGLLNKKKICEANDDKRENRSIDR